MTEILTGDFLKMSLQEVADLLLDSIDGKQCSAAKCYGTDDDGRKYALKVSVELCDDD